MVDREYNADNYKSLRISIRAIMRKSRNVKICS